MFDIRIKTKILEYLSIHPGARKREVAHSLKIWQCDFTFLRIFDELRTDGLIRYEIFRDSGNMEFYDKWYVTF